MNSGKLVEATDLRDAEHDLLNIGMDCICYSDCTEFRLENNSQKITCDCVYW